MGRAPRSGPLTSQPFIESRHQLPAIAVDVTVTVALSPQSAASGVNEIVTLPDDASRAPGRRSECRQCSVPPRNPPSSRSPEPSNPSFVDAVRDRKGDDVTALDLRDSDAFTDYFVVCTGQNRRQVQAIADAVETALRAKKLRPAHVEGYDRGEWVLLDYFDFVVHVFSPTARTFYGLERLWGNAESLSLPKESPAAAV